MLTRRRFLAGGAITAAALGIYAGEIERHLIDTVERTIFVRNLPPAFHGFRIVQLSDFHYKSYDEPFFIRHAVDTVNRLKPDMVALTGDFITSNRVNENSAASVMDANECAELLSGIHCPLRFSSLGNHDAILPTEVKEALQKHRLSPLVNEQAAVDLKGDRIWVAGLADAYYDIPNLPLAIPDRKANEPVILLGHEPDFANTVSRAMPGKVDLMLAGHTHGGQVRVPFLPAILLPAMGEQYVEGHFSLANDLQLYVNRGLGCMHLPFRFNCPPELTVLTLKPQ